MIGYQRIQRLNSRVRPTFTETDFQRLAQQFDPHELLRLYDFLTRRLHRTQALYAVVTTRLPGDDVQSLTRLAIKRRLTRSELVREAVMEFVQRHRT